MKHISILVPKGAILGSVEGPRLLLSQVNNLLSSKGISPLFKIELIGLTKETPLSGGLFTAHSDHTLDEIRKTDLIIIPAIDGDLKNAIEENKAFIPWITDRYKQGSEIASLCLGAFLLASTGLLNGKKCATHWAFENQFREMFPDVNLVPEKVIIDEKGIYSSGGAYSYLNLILYLIEKYAGRELAILCSKIFAIEIERNSQSAFNIFQGQKEHGDEPIKTAQEFIESNFSEKITVDQLASRLALGRRNMERRFKKATSNTVVEYIQRVKVEAAKKGFETSRKNINEVMMDVGYSDIKAFRTVFKRITGLSPVEYKNKYNYN
ncbi:MAG: helix-turn-helix domain-containing protein [Bacteroidetes bacterium]|nr:helix-turn-helix domain-containing protein [Bacteroidota bacterium]